MPYTAHTAARARILDAILAAWRATRNPGHSDLDNEQPISLSINCTLGDLRKLDLMGVEQEGGHGEKRAYNIAHCPPYGWVVCDQSNPPAYLYLHEDGTWGSAVKRDARGMNKRGYFPTREAAEAALATAHPATVEK